MLVLLAVTSLALQQSVADTSPFRALALPVATGVRSAYGAPWTRYWQQRADYTIHASLDTGAKVLTGTERISYVNRYPEALAFVWVQREQNLFAPGSITSVLNPPPLRFAGGAVFDFTGKGFVGGLTVDRFTAAGRPLATTVTGTMMRVELPLPAGFVVAATGAVANPLGVWTAQQRARLERARRSSERVQIITKAEATAHGAQRKAGTKTWRFTAPNVRDFAWAAGPDLRWDASGWIGILIQTFYHPDAAPWEDANKMVRAALSHFSETWLTYPWPQFSSVEGLVEGMEYPMITFCPALEKREDQFWVLAHELGHQWFPMIVGSDERRYPWMDEGFNTFIDYGSAEGYFKGT